MSVLRRGKREWSTINRTTNMYCVCSGHWALTWWANQTALCLQNIRSPWSRRDRWWTCGIWACPWRPPEPQRSRTARAAGSRRRLREREETRGEGSWSVQLNRDASSETDLPLHCCSYIPTSRPPLEPPFIVSLEGEVYPSLMRYSAAHWKSVKQFCLLANMPAKKK